MIVAPPRAGAVELPAHDMANRRCFNCHGQQSIADLGPAERQSMVSGPQPAPGASQNGEKEPATRPELLVSPEALKGSVHEGIRCVDCHSDAQELPHAQNLQTSSCSTSCHAAAVAGHRGGAHALAVAKGASNAPTCTTCHGGHQILSRRNPESPTYPLKVIGLCADCHEKHYGKTPAGHESSEFVASYLDSVHGKAVREAGLIVAATCVDCHSSHEVLPVSDPRSTVHRNHVPQTCGRCHTGIAQVYQNSVHAQQLALGNKQAPVCSDCHTAHAISRANTPAFALDIVNECGQCHDQPRNGQKSGSFYESYRHSYHGQVNFLGSTRAARCSDCHGNHEIRRISDPASPLQAANRVDVCRRCHPGAEASFALFQPHADFRDKARFPLLHAVWLYFIIVMSVTFAFFGLHCLLWFVRSLIERLRHGPAPVPTGPAIRRFNKVDRINHGLMIISFFGLTLTGMPLFFAEYHWAQNLATIMGGVYFAGWLHRIFAILLACNFLIHVAGVVHRRKLSGQTWLIFLTGPRSMLPRLRDFADCAAMFRYFLVGGKRPAFDHWTYWEKFDYWAEVFGTAVIGGTGLMLWFPLFFSRFLPGWTFNVATIIHGYEALLAVGFIFTIHFFNAHLRWEKFPVDDVIFTGRVPEDELKHERPVEYARLQASGELERLREEPVPQWQRRLAVIVGVLAMAIGTTMVVLIILAGLKAI